MASVMTRARFNGWVFVLEGLNSLGTTYYFNYLFFYLKAEFGFTSLQNLLVCALNGFVYMGAAYYGGKFGQRHGYLRALNLGVVIMSVMLAVSAFAQTVPVLMVLMVLWTLGMCFTWPNLEALAADHQSPDSLPGAIGIYNVVWAGASAIAYFSGGALAEAFGWRSIFWIPLIIHLVQLAVAFRVRVQWALIAGAPLENAGVAREEPHPQGGLFLKMAWVANPFAYIAINAVIPLIPDLALRLNLSPAQAGIFCSIWFFARMFTFIVLAVWPGWHYRFGYLMVSYAGMLACFAGILLLENFWSIVAVQLGFGWCVGLLYYSSLYYSMHVGDTKGEHGGVHEAALGAGIFGGPAIGAASLWLAPAYRQSSVIGVALVLAIGFGVLLALRAKRQPA
jgi:MFS family permease